jgi:hypothetical protein
VVSRVNEFDVQRNRQAIVQTTEAFIGSSQQDLEPRDPHSTE